MQRWTHRTPGLTKAKLELAAGVINQPIWYEPLNEAPPPPRLLYVDKVPIAVFPEVRARKILLKKMPHLEKVIGNWYSRNERWYLSGLDQAVIHYLQLINRGFSQQKALLVLMEEWEERNYKIQMESEFLIQRALRKGIQEEPPPELLDKTKQFAQVADILEIHAAGERLEFIAKIFSDKRIEKETLGTVQKLGRDDFPPNITAIDFINHLEKKPKDIDLLDLNTLFRREDRLMEKLLSMPLGPLKTFYESITMKPASEGSCVADLLEAQFQSTVHSIDSIFGNSQNSDPQQANTKQNSSSNSPSSNQRKNEAEEVE